MRQDIYGQKIYSETDLCEFYLKNPEISLSKVLADKEILFDESLDLSDIPQIEQYVTTNLSVEDFDLALQRKWLMPEQYKQLDIAKYVLDLCTTEVELQRVGQELLLYQERDMFDLLRYLKFLVDTMRQHNIVWGVGRGSSVASYVLYLLGVHKINSIFYDLSIDEFLK